MIAKLVGFCNNNNLEIIGLYGLKRPMLFVANAQAGGISISFAYTGILPEY